jgi:hypothetical protein
MIADSPYKVGQFVLKPWVGMGAGLMGAVAMLALMLLLQPISGLRLADLLAQIGGIALPASLGRGPLVVTGIVLHVILGTSLGLLYAVCQQRVPLRGLIAVGFFYGFVLWVVGSVIAGPLFSQALRSVIRTWPWLLGNLLYGLCLAGVAAWAEVTRPVGTEIVVPKD